MLLFWQQALVTFDHFKWIMHPESIYPLLVCSKHSFFHVMQKERFKQRFSRCITIGFETHKNYWHQSWCNLSWCACANEIWELWFGKIISKQTWGIIVYSSSIDNNHDIWKMKYSVNTMHTIMLEILWWYCDIVNYNFMKLWENFVRKESKNNNFI